MADRHLIHFTPVFEDYTLKKGQFLLFGNGVFIDPERYELIDNGTIELTDERDFNHYIDVGYTMVILNEIETKELYGTSAGENAQYIWKIETVEATEEEQKINTSFLKTFKLRGVIPALIGFFCYIAIEQTTANWFSSMVVFNMGVAENTAANWAALFYVGIMVGRLLSGVVSLKINDKNLIRIGEGIILFGLILMCMQFNVYLMPVALVLIGFGCAPIYPAIIHSTPNRFTVEHSQSVMSIQMGFAYIANVAFAPLFGVIGKNTTFLILPYVIIGVLILSVVSNELVNKLTQNNQKKEIAK